MPHNPPPDDAGYAARERVSFLLRVVLLVFGGQIAILSVVQFLFARRSPVFEGFFLGDDFAFYHAAARAWLSGRNPYTVFGFVTPPPSLLVPALLAQLSEAAAASVFFYCNLLLVALSLWWFAGALRLQRPQRLLLLLSAALFISAQQCVRGGNLDGLMFALLVAAFCARRPLGGSFWLASSIVTKLYSVVFLPVALRRKQWRFAAFTAAWVLCLLLPFHHLWSPALHALAGRNQRYLFSSIAPATLVFALSARVPTRAGGVLCLAFWAVTFGVALYRDRERELSPYTLARYVPWMLALPALVFSYVGVLALASLASLMATAAERRLQKPEWCGLTGFLLLGIHVEKAGALLPLPFDIYHRAALIQSAGVVLMMVGSCLAPSAKQSSM